MSVKHKKTTATILACLIALCLASAVYPGYLLHSGYSSNTYSAGCTNTAPLFGGQFFEQTFSPLYSHLEKMEIAVDYDEALAEGVFLTFELADSSERILFTCDIPLTDLACSTYSDIPVKKVLKPDNLYSWRIYASGDVSLQLLHTEIAENQAPENQTLTLAGDVLNGQSVSQYHYTIHPSMIYILQGWLGAVLLLLVMLDWIRRRFSSR